MIKLPWRIRHDPLENASVFATDRLVGNYGGKVIHGFFQFARILFGICLAELLKSLGHVAGQHPISSTFATSREIIVSVPFFFARGGQSSRVANLVEIAQHSAHFHDASGLDLEKFTSKERDEPLAFLRCTVVKKERDEVRG